MRHSIWMETTKLTDIHIGSFTAVNIELMNSVIKVHSENMWNTRDVKTTKWSSPLPPVTQMKDYRGKSWEEMGCTVSLAFPKPFSDCNRGRCWSTVCDWTDWKMYHLLSQWDPGFTWSSALVWFVSWLPLFQSELSLVAADKNNISFKLYTSFQIERISECVS